MLLTPESRLPPAEGWSDARCQGRWELEKFRRLQAVSTGGAEENADVSGGSEAQRPEAQQFVEADVAVRRDAAGIWRLQGEARAVLGAMCQRCLDPLTLEVSSDVDVALDDVSGASDGDAGVRDEAVDWPAGGMTLGELLEDEIFLAMPQVPVHPDRQGCGKLATRLEEFSDAGAGPGPTGEAETRPFAGLRDLLSAATADRKKND